VFKRGFLGVFFTKKQLLKHPENPNNIKKLCVFILKLTCLY